MAACLVGANALVYGLNGAYSAFMPVYLSAHHSSIVKGNLLSIGCVVSIFAPVLWGKVTDKARSKGAVLAMLVVLSALFFGASYLSASVGYLAVMMALLTLFRAPFDETTLADLNAWVSDRTDGMIPAILDRIPGSAMVYLVNALAFDGQWESVYRENQIHEGTFTAEDGAAQPVQMMYSQEYAYLEDGLATGFLKYYEGGTYAFAALLPNEGVSLEDYIASLTGEGLR